MVKKRRRRKKKVEEEEQEIKALTKEEFEAKYVTKENSTAVIRPITLEDDEYGSEYSEDQFGKMVKKEIYQPE